MTLWFFRLLTIALFPIIGWFKIGHDAKGILIGVAAALFIIGIEILIERISINLLIYGIIGAGIGFIFSWILTFAISFVNEPVSASYVQKFSFYVYLVFTYLGMVIMVRRQQEIDQMDRGGVIVKGRPRRGSEFKVLDTSAIIDGRIADVFETKFLTGSIIVGRFVLKELQTIADASDSGKRARGRRGLDILQRLQENPEMEVKIYDKDYPEIKDVDGKLVALAKELDAQVLTTDFNLNKVAALQGVTVLNINDLANALRPAVLPGEHMSIFVAKDGKEKEQGIGYLDDGTMVVIEEGRRHVGKKMDTTVTSVLQTSAGRMIFTRLRDKERD